MVEVGGASAATLNISGTFTMNSFPGGFNGPFISATGGSADCTIFNGNEFSCTASSPWTGEITISGYKLVGNSPCRGSDSFPGVALATDTSATLTLTCEPIP